MKYNLLALILLFFAIQYSTAQDGVGSWTQTYNNNGRIYGIVVDPSNPYTMYHVSLDSGAYKSINGGLTWFQINNGLTYKGVFCMAVAPSNGNYLYLGTDQNGSTNSGMYTSTDGGNTWFIANNGIVETSRGIQQIAVHPTNPLIAYMTLFDGLVASTNGLYKTTNGGGTWVASSNGITNKSLLSVVINPLNPNVMYAGTSLILPAAGPSQIYKSFDAGANWVVFSNGLPTLTTSGDPVRCLSISTFDTSVIAAGLFRNDTLGGLFVTTNSGNNWVRRYTPFDSANTLIRSLAIRLGTSDEIAVGMDHGTSVTRRGVWRSTDKGMTWTTLNTGLMSASYPVRALAYRVADDYTLFAGAASTTLPGRGIFEYTWNQTFPTRTWSEQTSGLTTALYSVSAVDNNIAWISGASGKVLRTTNSGALWTSVGGNIPTTAALYNIFGLNANVAIVLTSPSAGGSVTIYKTSNGGTNWATVYTLTAAGAFGDALWMTDANNAYYYGDPVGGNWHLLKSTNGGDNWTTWATVATTAAGWNNGMFFLGNSVWFGGNSSFMMYSSNLGVNWSQQTTPTANSYVIWFNNFLNGLSGNVSLFQTTNGGLNWATLTSPITTNVSGVCGIGQEWWACPQTTSVHYTSNNGTAWSTAYTAPAGNFYHLSRARNGYVVWGVRSNGGIARFGGPLTGIIPVENQTPTSYNLSQNYPNPFNPVTKINFDIPKQGLVTLKIYDVLGRLVTTLVDEVKNAGSYSVDFNAEKLSSGTYFYKLESGDFVTTKKMTLIK
jgi:photosystem II stability/assembly factor-like uncharacterized protein